MELAIISDSHVPSRASRIPEAFEARIRDADHVIHAGDFDAEGTLANVRAMASELTAVAGNMDPAIGLPEAATVELEGVEFVITHGTGPLQGYEERVASTVRSEATTAEPIGVAGHTHEVFDRRVDSLRLLNPGSVTGAAPASRTTMYTAEVANGDVDLTLHEL